MGFHPSAPAVLWTLPSIVAVVLAWIYARGNWGDVVAARERGTYIELVYAWGRQLVAMALGVGALIFASVGLVAIFVDPSRFTSDFLQAALITLAWLFMLILGLLIHNKWLIRLLNRVTRSPE